MFYFSEGCKMAEEQIKIDPGDIFLTGIIRAGIILPSHIHPRDLRNGNLVSLIDEQFRQRRIPVPGILHRSILQCAGMRDHAHFMNEKEFLDAKREGRLYRPFTFGEVTKSWNEGSYRGRFNAEYIATYYLSNDLVFGKEQLEVLDGIIRFYEGHLAIAA